jgi:putative Flp pilus-assembly TadE/G-like protein
MRNQIQRLRRDERGMSLVFVGFSLMGFLAATTLAIDVGMMMTARSQAQNSADAGALNDYNNRSATGPAVTSAIGTAQANAVMSGAPSVLPADVTFPNDPAGNPNRVRVQVFRTTERGNPIPTFLASMFGVPTASLGASATAEVSTANAQTCVRPFMIPDKWAEHVDAMGNPDGPWTPNSDFNIVDNRGQALTNPDVYIPRGQSGYTGYSEMDYGMMLMLRAGTGNNIFPTMYYSWSMPSMTGADDYRGNISGCNKFHIPLGINPPFYMTQEPGNMVGPTNQGIDDLILQDSSATFDQSCVCVKNSSFGVSPRITPLPLYDPMYYATGKMNGRNADFKLANVMGFFIDHRSGNNVYGYIMPLLGMDDGSGGPAPTGTLSKVIRLVQ